MSFHCPDKYRVRKGQWATSNGEPFGAFFIPIKLGKPPLQVIATDGVVPGSVAHGWEHVSVSLPDRCPTWDETCLIKSLFWDPDDCVVQFHPPQSEYVNNHPYCLHLWRPIGVSIPMPPSITVGYKERK